MQSEAYDLLVLGQLTYITASHANLANRLKIHNFKKNQQCCYRPRWVAVSLSDSVELREGNFLGSILWIFAHKKKNTKTNTEDTGRGTQWRKKADLLWRRQRPPRPGNGSSPPSFSGKTPSTRHCWLLQSGICLTGPGKKRRMQMMVKLISLRITHQHVVADVSELLLHLLPVLFGLRGGERSSQSSSSSSSPSAASSLTPLSSALCSRSPSTSSAGLRRHFCRLQRAGSSPRWTARCRSR